MLGDKYFVCMCKKCSKHLLYKIQFLEYNEKCCLDFKSHKELKVFNDEKEARNFLSLYEDKEEE